jgi:dipeptide/tripeptide permease
VHADRRSAEAVVESGAGLLLGLVQYVAFRRNLGAHGRTVPNPLPRASPLSYRAVGAILSTVLGGWIADRLLGMERTVVYGGVVVMCGHIALASMPGLAGVAVGLVLVASVPAH